MRLPVTVWVRSLKPLPTEALEVCATTQLTAVAHFLLTDCKRANWLTQLAQPCPHLSITHRLRPLILSLQLIFFSHGPILQLQTVFKHWCVYGEIFLDRFPMPHPVPVSLLRKSNSPVQQHSVRLCLNKKGKTSMRANEKHMRPWESAWCIWLWTKLPRYRERHTHPCSKLRSSIPVWTSSSRMMGWRASQDLSLEGHTDMNCDFLHSYFLLCK